MDLKFLDFNFKSSDKVYIEKFLEHTKPSESFATQLIIVSVVICYFAHDTAPTILWLSWGITMSILTLVRVFYLNRLHKNKNISPLQRVRILISIAIVGGVIQSSSILLFPYLTFVERVFHSVIFLGLSLGSLTSSTGMRHATRPYNLTLLVPLAIAWAIVPYPSSTLSSQLSISLLIAIYLFAALAQNKYLYKKQIESYESDEKLKNLNSRLNVALESATKANQSKTRFLALASHDLRQPIHTLSLFSTALSLQELNTKGRKIAAQMEVAIDALATQMDTLLDISKLDAGLVEANRSVMNLYPLIHKMESEYIAVANKKGISLKLNISSQDSSSETDLELLERIFRNLLTNAIRYTDEGMISIKFWTTDTSNYISVIDTGRGVSEDDQKYIFDEFYQADNKNRDRKKGLGLGLAVVKRLTELLQISLSLESQVGVGTRVTLCLPKSEGPAPGIRSDVSIAPVISHHLLFIDDEESIREALKTVFSDLGCLVQTAASTREAVNLAKLMKPDVVLADFRLAGCDSGIRTIQEIRKLYPQIPALLVSGDTAPERLRQAAEANLTMLHKPIKASKLLETINKLLA